MTQDMRILLAFALTLQAVAQTTSPAISAMVTASGFGGYEGIAAPGSYVEIYGTNLAGTSRAWATADFIGTAAPTSLDGVTVTVNSTPAFINYVSPGQVNIEIQDTIALGNASVVVTFQGQSSTAATLVINAQQPGLLAPASFKIDGKQYVTALHASGTFVGNSNIPDTTSTPAVAGETLVFYGTGFGAVTNNQVAGKIASGQTSLTSAFAMTIGGINATVQYAGLAPGLVGVYQFNVVVPGNLPTGDLPVQFSLNGTTNNLQTLFLAVRSTAVSSTFTLTSSVGASGGVLPADYTCDGTGSTLPLSWSNAPSGTKEFAVMMTTLPGDGTTKWNWVLYNLRPTLTSIAKDAFLVGTIGVGSDGPGTVYNPPCSQGPGAKVYTYTVYALSDSPTFSVPVNQVNGQRLADAISSITLASASLSLSATRATNPAGSTAACARRCSSGRDPS